MAHTELNLDERRTIEKMHNAKMPVSQIAQEIGRHRSTVYREIQRNSFTDDEQPDLHAHVVACLKIGWSPEQISGRLRLDNSGISVSHETIYAFVYSREGQSAELARYLPRRRKKRRSRFAGRLRGQVFPPERSIHQRPDSVKSRDAFGDWEGDLMIFERANGNMKVASLVERKTRFAVLFRNNDRRSGHFFNKLMDIIEPLPQPRTAVYHL